MNMRKRPTSGYPFLSLRPPPSLKPKADRHCLFRVPPFEIDLCTYHMHRPGDASTRRIRRSGLPRGVVWDVQDPATFSWTPMTACREVEAAYLARTESLAVAGGKIDFRQMGFTPATGGTTRRIRRNAEPPAVVTYQWEYVHPSGKWFAYAADAQNSLEDHLRRGLSSCLLTIPGRAPGAAAMTLTVDLVRMIQVTAQGTRNVRRVPAGGPKGSPDPSLTAWGSAGVKIF